MTVSLRTPPRGTIRDWLNQRAEKDGDKVAYLFVDGTPALSWAELRQEARVIAEQLTAQGLGKSATVAILQPNGRAAITSFYGVVYGGFCATVINLIAGTDAVRYALDHSEARIALVGEAQTGLFDAARNDRIERMRDTPPPPDTTPLHDLYAKDDALLMYTSGTTGQPKGVVHSHASLLAGGWTPTVAHQLTAQDCGLCVLPIYHINGLCVSVISTLISGGALAVAERFSVSRFWEHCKRAEVTWFSVVPTIISHLLHSDITPDEATKARIRFGRSASAPLAPDVQNGFEERFGVPIVETMGLTETAAQILSNPLPPGLRKIGSPGVAFGNEACILAQDQSRLPPDIQGEIAIRGPNVMCGYLKNPEATAASFTPDGWLRTGDLGHIDKDGYIFVTGRLKELIIKGGENIAPREIDDALYSHPDVIEAAAFARPCNRYGERVEAAVKLKDGSNLTPAKLIEICHEKLGTFKSPDMIFVLEDLPKGPSGKIQRIKLPQLLSVDPA